MTGVRRNGSTTGLGAGGAVGGGGKTGEAGGGKRVMSKLNLVDLAGSERLVQTGSTGEVRWRGWGRGWGQNGEVCVCVCVCVCRGCEERCGVKEGCDMGVRGES